MAASAAILTERWDRRGLFARVVRDNASDAGAGSPVTGSARKRRCNSRSLSSGPGPGRTGLGLGRSRRSRTRPSRGLAFFRYTGSRRQLNVRLKTRKSGSVETPQRGLRQLAAPEECAALPVAYFVTGTSCGACYFVPNICPTVPVWDGLKLCRRSKFCALLWGCAPNVYYRGMFIVQKCFFNSQRCPCWRVVGTSATATISTSAAGSVVSGTAYGLLDRGQRADRPNHYDGGSAPVHGRPSGLRSSVASAIKTACSQKDAGRNSQRERTLLSACYHQRSSRAHDGRYRCLACRPFSCRRSAGWYRSAIAAIHRCGPHREWNGANSSDHLAGNRDRGNGVAQCPR